MSVAVTCPECQERYEVPDEAAQQLIRCRRCQCPIEAKRHAPASEAIQAKPEPVLGSASRLLEDDDNPQPDRPRPHPKPRSPFPWTALLVVVIGMLLLLLVFSVGFNVWFIVNPDRHLRIEEARRAEQVAIQQRMEAERAAAMAQQEEKRARENQAKAQADLAAAKKFREAGDQLPWGTLQGRVVWQGDLPQVKDLEGVIRMNVPKLPNLNAPKGTFLDPTWRIHPKTKGVANVVVYLKRPANGMLPIHPDDRVRKDPVVMDAPFCVFVPHVVPFYPKWFDGKDGAKTEQKFIIKNSSSIRQSARTAGNPRFNEDRNHSLPPSAELEYVLNPQPSPVEIRDDIYTWKKAYAWVFDHPYFAITDTDGAFTIQRVPADTQVQVMAWHESQVWLFTKDGRTIKLTRGKNSLDFEMSAK
jgi:hypothetical protein